MRERAEELARQMRDRAEQLARQARVLGELSRRGIWREGDRLRAFEELTEAAAHTLGVERVGIWLYDAEHTQVVCADLYQATEARHDSGTTLLRRDYPSYFAALEKNRTIAADDAAHDPRTSEFAADYLRELSIVSMLDAPILTEGRCVGVVCHEQIGRQRHWSEEDQSFAGSVADLVALAIEGDQRRGVEAALREREEELRLALEAANMGTWHWDLRSDEVRWSEQVGAILGRGRGWQAKGSQGYLECICPEDREEATAAVRAALEGPEDACFLHHRIQLGDGERRWVELRGQIHRGPGGEAERLAGVLADDTERRELEEQLRQAQKMESIGRLAGGVAHDFNNLLTVIAGYAELLDEAEDLGEVREDARLIREAVERAASLTQQLLTFARRQAWEPRVFDLRQLVEDLGELLARLLGDEIALELRLAPGPLRVRADPTQVEQVLVNLAVNARDAMEEGGRLTLEAGSARPEAGEIHPDPGECVRLSVTDTGCGIPEDSLGAIFEPFYTTKQPGRGTGLGLSTCYGIVHQAGGEIRVESRLGVGTRFEVWLPLAS